MLDINGCAIESYLECLRMTIVCEELCPEP